MSFALLLSVLLPVHPDDLAQPDLAGIVASEDGKPVAGATVLIYTAGPRKGVGVL